MILAPVGARILHGKGPAVLYTVAPQCADRGRRYWLCVIHDKTYPTRRELDQHAGAHCALASLCWDHGVEAA
jgi:hypothetical protein